MEIKYHRLSNGLELVFSQSKSSPFTAFNLLYKVGSRDEKEDRTGFAHLFEHLMFSGSKNILHYDTELQKAGGENNAFTNNDITNYYINLPKQNIETAFWLESDRMNELAFSEKGLEVQRNVVIEEFKQRYLNQPYGDVWLYLRPLAYKIHPYKWATIGKDISHIENAAMDEVKDFFYSHYAPNNAILSIVGDHDFEDIVQLTETWFGPIEQRKIRNRELLNEPVQEEFRTQTLERDVPYHSFYRAYHIFDRLSPNYQAVDLISDILSNGDSSRFNRKLVKELKLFSEINAYISGDADPGLFIIAGTLLEGIYYEQALRAVDEELELICGELPGDYEFNKVKNKVESSFVFSNMTNLNKAMNLAYYQMLGDASGILNEMNLYRKVRPEQIRDLARKIFTKENCSELIYKSKQLG